MIDIQNQALWPGWETVRLIGRGSFGAVYEIERDVLNHKEKAALKAISIPQNSSDIEELYDSGYSEESVTETFKSHMESIINEYSLMREMNGTSNVVNCDDFRVVQHEDGIGWDIYIKMELLTPLPKAIEINVSEDEVIRIGMDICRALVLCKKYGIVHRDIKPQNIFASQNGDYKLGDFGIAKTIERTTGGTKIGTYNYMAPEVYNNQPYGSAADIYSLGLVLYWLLNKRRLPFQSAEPKASDIERARLRRFQGETIPAPRNGSRMLKQIVLKACEYNSKDRYADASEMLADLVKLQSAETIETQEESIENLKGKSIPWMGEKGLEEENGEGTVGIWSEENKGKNKNTTVKNNVKVKEKGKEDRTIIFWDKLKEGLSGPF